MDIFGRHSSNGLHGLRDKAKTAIIEYLRKENAVHKELNSERLDWNRLLALVME